MANRPVDLKVVLLGSSSVGKSALVERFLHGRFVAIASNTVGAAFGAKSVQVEQRTITLGIWDTAGAERFESLSRLYYRAAAAAIVCYDVTRKETFERVKFWTNELRGSEPNCSIYVVATKMDLAPAARQVPEAEAREYAVQSGATHWETSSASGEGVEPLFEAIARDFAVKRGIAGPGAGGTGTPRNPTRVVRPDERPIALEAAPGPAGADGRPPRRCCT
eukprot:tig00001493_g8982.t1